MGRRGGKVLRVVAVASCSAVVLAQVPLEQATKDLTSPDTNVRLKAVRQLKSAANPEAAVPLAAAVTDSEDSVQFEAIAAAMNIYLAEKVVPKKRVALVVEVRSKIEAEATFLDGPSALNAQIVPDALLAALLRASRDDNPRVALDALYTFGALADNQSPSARAPFRSTGGPDLTGLLGVPQLEMRIAAARVIGRLYERRATDPAVDEAVGDSVVRAVNDSGRDVRFAAMDALGAMRYERAVKSLTDLYQVLPAQRDWRRGGSDAGPHWPRFERAHLRGMARWQRRVAAHRCHRRARACRQCSFSWTHSGRSRAREERERAPVGQVCRCPPCERQSRSVVRGARETKAPRAGDALPG